ncbi:MAG TPA: serine hydrolase domain-containing protein [Enteractinococcus sp.]
MEQYEVPGAEVLVAAPEGMWSTEQGVTDLESGDPIESGMAWPLRSVTKSVVVTVLLQLVDEGEVSLEDTIDQYVNDVPNGGEITLHQLANMTSGVGDYTRSESFLHVLMGNPSQSFTLEALNRYGLAEGAQFEPGIDHVYSNTATNLLGVVIEEVTGKWIAEVIDQRIIQELGLADTVYAESEDDWVSPHAQGHQPAEGEVAPIFNNFSAMGASGAMISTTTEMAVWAKALATGELISPELHEERLVGEPLSEGPEYDEYALGIGSIVGWWGHTGEGLGFTSLVMHDEQSDASVVIFMNISQAIDAETGKERHVPTALMREYARILAAHPW